MAIDKMASEEYVDSKVGAKYTKPVSGIPASDLSAAVQASLGKADTALQEHQSLAAYVNGASYDSTAKKILLKHDDTIIAEVDATSFIKDGMVSSVELVGGNIVITFNTDAGLEPIEIPLTDIFNPDNYYDKTSADERFVAKETGKGLSTNDYTDVEKEKVAAATTKLAGIDDGAQKNVIEVVKRNGTALTPEDGAVDVNVPTKLNDVCPETENWLGVPGTTIAGKSIKVLAKTVNGVIEGGMTVTASSANDNNTTKYRYGGVTATRNGVATDYLFDNSQYGIARHSDIAVKSVKVNGTALVPDENNAVNVTVPQASNTTPKVAGTATIGSSSAYSRGDHRHPTDTSRAPLASPTFTGTPKAPTPSVGDSSTKVATTEFVQREKLYRLIGNWTGITPPGGNTVSYYALSSLTASLNVITPASFMSGRVLDFIVDVQNSLPSQARINFGGLGSDWYAVVNDGEDLTDMSTLAGNEIARFHFTQMAFTKNDKPVMWITKQIVTEVESSGGSYQLEADGTVTTEGELNTDGTFTVEGELNTDGTFTVEAI